MENIEKNMQALRILGTLLEKSTLANPTEEGMENIATSLMEMLKEDDISPKCKLDIKLALNRYTLYRHLYNEYKSATRQIEESYRRKVFPTLLYGKEENNED